MSTFFISAAFRLANGEVLSTGCFHDIEAVPEGIEIVEEGFIGVDGCFYNRQQASVITKKNNVQSEDILECLDD